MSDYNGMAPTTPGGLAHGNPDSAVSQFAAIIGLLVAGAVFAAFVAGLLIGLAIGAWF